METPCEGEHAKHILIEYIENYFPAGGIFFNYDPLVDRWNFHFSPLILSNKLCFGIKLFQLSENYDPAY